MSPPHITNIAAPQNLARAIKEIYKKYKCIPRDLKVPCRAAPDSC